MVTYFNNIHDIFESIKSNSFNREYAWEIANAYIFEENKSIEFNEKLFDGFGFLFDFLLSEQFEISDEDFKTLIGKILNIDNELINPIEIKKVLYEKQLNELKIKFEKNYISKEIYKNQISKYLD